jgi:hypothetical protein
VDNIYPIQEFVETDSQALSTAIAQKALTPLTTGLIQGVSEAMQDDRFSHFTEGEREAIKDAMLWQIYAKIASSLSKSGELWCESYYRALKRLYEGSDE